MGAARPEAEKAAGVLARLCAHFRSHTEELPDTRLDDGDDQRVIDYVSGMTDRFALSTYESRFLPQGIA
jgi:dGTPase